MSRSAPNATQNAATQLAPTLRRLAAGLRSGGDAAAILATLERALHGFSLFDGAHLELASESASFDTARLALPLLGGAGPLGLMRIDAGASGEFSTGQIQLAGAVADVAAVVLEHALRAHGQSASVDLLAVALDELTLGVLCFDHAGTLLFANAAARAFLGGRIPAQWSEIWSQLAPAARREPGTPFVRREGGRLIHITARKPTAAGPGAVVLADLAPRVGAFGETLAGEVYRSLVERSRLTLGVLAGPEGSPAALECLESLRAQLGSSARVGPIDAEAAGIIAPGLDATALLRAIRVAVASEIANGMRVGVAALRSGSDTPEAILARATASLQPLGARRLPELLVCDRSAAVNETLALILRHDFAVTIVPRWDQGISLLGERLFDGLVFELPAVGDHEAGDFAKRAFDLQPGARKFFVTDFPGPWDFAELGLPQSPVFRKPFAVRELRAAVQSAFATP